MYIKYLRTQTSYNLEMAALIITSETTKDYCSLRAVCFKIGFNTCEWQLHRYIPTDSYDNEIEYQFKTIESCRLQG